MNIKIGDYRIKKVDELNLVVEHYRAANLSKNPLIAAKQSHEKKWHFVGYYDKVENALNKIVSHSLVNNEEIKSANNLIEKIEELREFIRDAIPTK